MINVTVFKKFKLWKAHLKKVNCSWPPLRTNEISENVFTRAEVWRTKPKVFRCLTSSGSDDGHTIRNLMVVGGAADGVRVRCRAVLKPARVSAPAIVKLRKDRAQIAIVSGPTRPGGDYCRVRRCDDAGTGCWDCHRFRFRFAQQQPLPD